MNTNPVTTPAPIAPKPPKKRRFWLKAGGAFLVLYVGFGIYVNTSPEVRAHDAASREMLREANEAGQAAYAEREAARVAEREERRAAREARLAPAREARDLALREDTWLQVTKQAVRESLRDPGSAEFRNVALYRPVPGRTTPVVCGEVNADNGFSGRTGFQGFIGSGRTFGPFLEEQMAPGEWASVSREMCVNAAPVSASAG